MCLLFTCSCTAQEICNNGKDDDGDGLIDLNDPDCACHVQADTNLLLNPSFEEYKHCPIAPWAYYNNFDVAYPWVFGENGYENTYQFHLSCPEAASILFGSFPNLKIPEGSGLVWLINAGTFTEPEITYDTKYVAQCLQTPLKKGRDYTISCYFMKSRHIGNLRMGVFGHADCKAVPFGVRGTNNNGCPLNYPGWVQLGSSEPVYYNNHRTQLKIKLTIPEDINVIQLGIDCASYDGLIYMLIDDVHLAETKEFHLQYLQIKQGDACTGNYVLQAPSFANASYQWYRNGIALPGETKNVYDVPDSSAEASYVARIDTGTNCLTTEALSLLLSKLSLLNLPADNIVCSDSSVIIGKAFPGVYYKWNGIRDSVVHITKAGNYSITATDSLGCQKNFNVTVRSKSCSDCSIYIPNAFTPNGDGLNDVLRAHSNCAIAEYDFQLYDRWGKKLFETSNINEAWDGKINGAKVPPGAYVYFVRYKNSSSENTYKIRKGAVSLLR
jgi:gliding motility-associated-like protein